MSHPLMRATCTFHIINLYLINLQVKNAKGEASHYVMLYALLTLALLTKRLNYLCLQLYSTVSLLYKCHTTCFGYI
jgi:hypothetical protein